MHTLSLWGCRPLRWLLHQVVACRFNRIVLELEEMQPENAQYLYRFTLDPATGSAASEKVSGSATHTCFGA
jgi:hypothetical protein